MMDDYNYIDLFHGIGGFALGAYMAGMKFKNHFYSDIEKYCQRLYKLRFPDSIQLGDITKIDTKDLKRYGNKWIITGGFPCQDISIAGKGAGITGNRSGLWFDYRRIIRDLLPDFAIMENVSALSFRGFDIVLGSLSQIGYNAEWQDIRAADMGAPHKRERIWLVAYPETGKISDTQKIGIQRGRTAGQQITETHEKEGLFMRGNSGQRKNHWTIEPELDRLADGIPHRMDRLKGLGNSIVPQITKILFEQIKPLLN